MEKQSKPALDTPLLALRSARASLLLASLRRSRKPLPSVRRSPSPAGPVPGLLHGEVAAARREATVHARIAGSELLLVLAAAPLVLLFLLLILLLAEAP